MNFQESYFFYFSKMTVQQIRLIRIQQHKLSSGSHLKEGNLQSNRFSQFNFPKLFTLLITNCTSLILIFVYLETSTKNN